MLVRILWFTREESTSIRWCDDQPIPTGGGTVNPATPGPPTTGGTPGPVPPPGGYSPIPDAGGDCLGDCLFPDGFPDGPPEPSTPNTPPPNTPQPPKGGPWTPASTPGGVNVGGHNGVKAFPPPCWKQVSTYKSPFDGWPSEGEPEEGVSDDEAKPKPGDVVSAYTVDKKGNKTEHHHSAKVKDDGGNFDSKDGDNPKKKDVPMEEAFKDHLGKAKDRRMVLVVWRFDPECNITPDH